MTYVPRASIEARIARSLPFFWGPFVMPRRDGEERLTRVGKGQMETHRHPVLVVDGEDREREGLTYLLALRGIDIVAVKNGQAALEALADGARCCMIILERSMARTAGYALLAPEGADPALRRLPVVVIPYRAASYAAGESICYALPKPVDPDTIRLLLARECAANLGSPAVRHSDLTWPVDLTT